VTERPQFVSPSRQQSDRTNVLDNDRRIKCNDISAMLLHIVRSIHVQSGWQHSDPPSTVVLRHSQEGHRDLALLVALESRAGLYGSGGPVTSYLWQSVQIENPLRL